MKHNIKFDHSKKNLDAFGLTDERFEEIKEFTDFYLPKICANKPLSFVVQEILEFANNPFEAMVIYGKIEADKAVKRFINKNAKGIEIIDGYTSEIPKEILDDIKRTIKNLINEKRAQEKNTPDNIQNN